MADQNLYTLRWIINNKWGDASYKNTANKIVSQEIGDWVDEVVRPEEKDRESISKKGQNLKYCPFAETNFTKAKTQGRYRKQYPEGAIVHFTAGRRNGLKSAMDWQTSQGYCYFVIDEDGNIGQNFPLNEWGSHAGRSSWPKLGSKWVSRYLVGIEVQCAGKLTSSGKSWFGKRYPAEETRNVSNKDNVKGGKYLKYTEKQEEALTSLILWLEQNNPNVFELDNVLGHDEVSPDRKNDPGGSLSMTMPEYRAFLKGQ